MNMLSLCRGFALVCLPAVLGIASAHADDARVPTDQLLPPGVLAYFSVSNVEDLKQRFGESNIGRLINDESLDEFRGQFDEQWTEAMNKGEEELGFPPSDLFDLVTGELAAAAVQPAGQELSWIVLMDVSGQEELLDKVLAKAEQALQEQDADKQIENVEETDVTVYEIPSKEEGEDGTTVAWFEREGLFVIGGNTALMEAVLVRWDGEHSRTFAAAEAYSHIMEQCTASESLPLMTWYLDPLGLVNGVLASNEELAMQSMMVAAYLPMLGLDRFKAVGGSMDLATDEFDSVSRTFLYVEQPASGVLKAFEFPAVEMAPPAWAPAEVTQYSAINWNLEAAYGAVETLYDLFTKQPGAFAALMDQVSTRPGSPMLHPKEDLVDQFTGMVHIVGRVDEEAGPQAQSLLVALDLQDEAAMKEVLEKVANSDGIQLEQRDFQGTTVFEAAEANAAGAQPAAAVFNGQLLFATMPQLLEEVLRNPTAAEPLAKAEDYARVAEHFPEEVSILGFQKQDAQLRMPYDLLKSGQFDGATEGKIDFSLLPDFEALEKYLTTTGSYAVPAENGALFVNFSLRAEE